MTDNSGHSITPYADTSTAQEVLTKFVDWADSQKPFRGQDILEIGCGGGHSTVEIAKHHPRLITALEPDPSHLDEANLKMIRANLGHLVVFMPGLAQDLLSDSGHLVDLTVWANGIHYLEDPEDLKRFFRVTREISKSGLFFCTAFWRGSLDRSAGRVMGRMRRFALENLGVDYQNPDVPAPIQLHEHSKEEYLEWAGECGFSRIFSLEVPMELPVDVYQGIAHDLTWVNNALPPTGSLARFSQGDRINALVTGSQKAYEYEKVETTNRTWLFVHAY